MSYEIKPSYEKLHPVKAAFFETIISQLWWVLIIFSACYLIICIHHGMTRKTIKGLLKTNSIQRKRLDFVSNNTRTLFYGHLYQISNKLGFNEVDKKTDRITLYIHDPKNNRFVPCGRVSPNPQYQKTGRTEYPDNEGCISEAWSNGWCYKNFNRDNKKRVAEHGEMNISENVSKNFNMPSLMYCAMRIEDGSGGQYAVLVVESTKKERFSEAVLKRELMLQNDYLCQLVQILKKHIPLPSNAASKGY
jgi:hypothetical protein